MKGKLGKNLIGVMFITAFLIFSSSAVVANTPEAKDKLASQPKQITRGFSDGFESYTDFVLSFSPWINVDVDGGNTYGATDYDWTNEHEPQSFIIFNPSQTTPPWVDDPDVEPHSGDKYAACFSTVPPDSNDDWLITPQVTIEAGDSFTFWARSYTDQWGKERFRVGISTTNPDPADFTILSTEPYIEAPVAWTEYTFDLSNYEGQDAYLAINCVSADAFFLMVDDVSVGEPGDDTTPPVTECTLEGEMSGNDYIGDVTVTLTATDDDSGVNYTMYKIDDGTYQEYSTPFVVSDIGNHTIYFYSVDIAGNIEDEKTCEFRIICPITIEITGGFGATATVINTGASDLTDVEWKITIDGLVLLGKEKSGKIDIPAGGNVEVKSGLVFGIGPVTIQATAGCGEATSSGLLLLFLILGL